MKLATGLFALLVLSSSCKMMENAEKAANNSEKAANNSDTLRDLSTSLYMSAVSGGSEDSRREALEQMESAESFDLKARYAASFIKSQTYQLINPMISKIEVGDFNRFFTDSLLEDIPIIARSIAENMPKGYKFKVSSTAGKDGNVKAIAVALHETNKLYYQFSGNQNIKMQSILDIVMDALHAFYVEKKSIDELTEVQKRVLYYRKEFLYALEIRHKFLPLVAIAKISELNSSLNDKVSMLLRQWNVQMVDRNEFPENENGLVADTKGNKKIKKQKKNKLVAKEISPAEIEMSLKIFKHAIIARDFLAQINTSTPELPGIVKRLLVNMHIEEQDKIDSKLLAELDDAVQSLIN